ncbi:uncharacterized protein LOC120276479 [Dioscorea cayenensis subsp. rotundata]|uniref:Uncharacterized protein LOC120276479 n=1 Tax=Dioscorea cayennensis subsp. rotundata TaxID=55577 RepID=A0AB40CJB4_DIOCR|nr:uncharacterized protein LOC120276479 [Dioscorea cayenensis subsp. rotundata]XP_039139169.1 uncharacterized protein LOC120276479 [Dioscorea cayenensis subsp. rotundata]XP_039139170.1 uncharacterized protein LOC120276479 [Dioscorea cayenensis subsp. rotundata]XP_039139171.1 uncharacterized protein LOC120276479 [Dioscorea cayenensis subsp. rotundata]
MVERFFAVEQSLSAEPALALLSGPPSCGKTSLLFQFAINCASETSSGEVIFICNKRRLESKPPFLSQGIDPTSDVFQRIQMKYVEDEDGIKKYFAAFHLHESFPIAVIIDDFADFFSERTCQNRYANARGRDLAMVRTLALCKDAIAHAKGACKLLLADTHQGDNPRLLFIYKRWIHSIFTIQGDGSGSFIVSGSANPSTRLVRRAAKYSVALQYLVFEEMIDK